MSFWDANWAQTVQAATAVIAFPVIIVQLWFLRRNLLGATQDRLYAQYTEICKLFMQYPELRPYFYQYESDPGASVHPTAPGPTGQPESAQREAARVAFMCETILGLVEHAVLQKDNVPKDAWDRCWRPYALERVEQSDALEKFIDPNAHWYSLKMCEEMKSIKQEAEARREKRILAAL